MNMLYNIGDFVGYSAAQGDPVEPSVPASPRRWALLRVHPNRERKVNEKLLDRGMCCYHPRFLRRIVIERVHAWQKPIVQQRMLPLFPGVVFVPEYDAEDMPYLKGLADGISGYLRLGEQFATIGSTTFRDIWELEAALALPRSRREQLILEGKKEGVQVRIRQGSPFAAWIGRIDRIDDKGRIKVLINAVTREVSIELTGDQVELV